MPRSGELLEASRAVFSAEQGRQALIAELRAEQAERARAAVGVTSAAPPAAPAASAASPAAGRADASGESPAPAATTPAPAPDAAAPAAPAEPRRTRSGVQVLLLSIGVILTSVAAVVFLFVAYLVASLEVRSVIIGLASVLVLGVAWLLRRRGLAGTAEGVAVVAVVLLLLDVWIVRANALFGTDLMDARAYSGVALLVLAGVLLAARRVTSVRVPGWTAAGLVPAAVFLLASTVSDDGATATWAGGVAALAVSAAAWFLPASVSRAIAVGAGTLGGLLGLAAAPWTGEVPVLWSLWAIAALWGAWSLIAGARPAERLRPEAAKAGALLAGIAAALGPALEIADRVAEPTAVWLAPAAAGAVAIGAAAVRLLPLPRVSGLAPWAAVPALVVAAGAALFALPFAVLTVVDRVTASEFLSASGTGREVALASAAAAISLGAATLAVTFLLRAGRRFLPVPVALLAAAVFPFAASLDRAACVGVLLLAAAAALAACAALGVSTTVRVVLATGGGLAIVVALLTVASDPVLFSATVAAVVVLAVAGRVLSRAVWPSGAVATADAVHVVVAALGALTPADLGADLGAGLGTNLGLKRQ
mgnify:FL=1